MRVERDISRLRLAIQALSLGWRKVCQYLSLYHFITDKAIWLNLDQDGAEPSANSMAVLNLLRLADFLDKSQYKDKAKEIMTSFGDHLKKIPVALSKMICGYMYYQRASEQVKLGLLY